MNIHRLFLGVLIVLLGLMLLLNTFGILTVNAWLIFWPLVLILAGVWFLFRPVFLRHAGSGVENINIPLASASALRLKLKHGAGRLHLEAAPGGSAAAVTGMFIGGVEYDHHLHGDEMKVKLHTPSDIFWDFLPVASQEGLTWDVKLNRDVPLSLDINTGASESNLDLSYLNLKELEIKTGASATQVILPASAGYTHMKIGSGAASVKIQVPEGVAARFFIRHGMADIHVDSLRFPFNGKYYETPAFASCPNRVEAEIDTGVGAIEIR
ncbi:MAG: DUF5668 domain-containing protein [Anaerolineae bacterium]|nr:DUF5668 domain-containing protein [Anaerolineae bacterium]